MICAHAPCGCEFVPWRAKQKFCSHNCHDESRKRVDLERLTRLAFSGMPKAAIAREMGVSWITVRRWIATYGLERMWREQRYA
jgi:hypothetical protein